MNAPVGLGRLGAHHPCQNSSGASLLWRSKRTCKPCKHCTGWCACSGHAYATGCLSHILSISMPFVMQDSVFEILKTLILQSRGSIIWSINEVYLLSTWCLISSQQSDDLHLAAHSLGAVVACWRVWCRRLYCCSRAPFEYVKVFDCLIVLTIKVAIVSEEQGLVVWDHHVTDELDILSKHMTAIVWPIRTCHIVRQYDKRMHCIRTMERARQC